MSKSLGLTLAILIALFFSVGPAHGWETASPQQAGMDESKLVQARDYALTGGGSGCIIRGGNLVMSWGDQAARYDLKSTSKSIGVTVLGLALKDDLMKLDDAAQQYYPDIGVPPNAGDARLADIKIWHLATHTAGFDKAGGFEPLLFDPGAAWSYSDGGVNWLADCLTLAYHRDLRDLLFERVFSKLGISDADLTWRNNSYRSDAFDGVKRREFGSGVSANVDAMAKIGYLYLRRGTWAGEQILPESFIDLVRKPFPEIVGLPVRDPASYPNASNHYGLLWWDNGDGTLSNVPRDAYWSWGLYDSLIVVIPSLDLVVARAGSGWRSGWDGNYDVLKPFLEPICQSVTGDAPYPHSEVITSLLWADPLTIVHQADGSDTWPITWADDGEQYTAYGDGWGFEPKVPNKLSLGLAKVIGGPPGTGINIRSESGEQTGDGHSGKKASGMLMVNGTLYMLVRNADNNGTRSQLAWSSDHGVEWTWSTWKFAELGYPCFLNFGQDYAGARDGYVYIYSPDTPSAYNEADTIVLARVPIDSITDRNAYEFYSGADADGDPAWSADVARRKAVFVFPGGCNRIDVTYNAPLGRYLLITRSRAQAGGKDQFSMYDAPEPWGPWTTVFYTDDWDVDPGESAHVPAKWISADGKTCHLVFAGSDSFAIRQFTLTAVPTHGSPDLTGDAFVDFRDFSRMVQNWLQDNAETDIAPAPSGDGIVNWKDFAVLAEAWLRDVGLVAHWKLDEAEGLIAHDSAGGHDGTLNGNPIWRPMDGRIAGATELDGMGDYVSTPFILSPAAGRFSVFVWVKGGAAGQVVLSQSTGVNWLMADSSQGRLITELSRPSAGRVTAPPLVSEFAMTDGAWHRVAVVWTGTDRILYGDDVEVARDEQPFLAGAEGGLTIGAGAALEASSFFSGLIDDVRIYNLALKP
ncbi:MAG: serine hydrolase [Sedimentisphaerales bacterium]|jgi:CubicO group peptidase (beta-lactamase class C family)